MFLCHCIVLVPLGDRWDRLGGIRFLVQLSQQWYYYWINHFLCINIQHSCSMTDTSKSRNMSQTYRFDVLVRMGPFSSQDDVCESFKEILMPELKSVDWKIAPSPAMCLTRVLWRSCEHWSCEHRKAVFIACIGKAKITIIAKFDTKYYKSQFNYRFKLDAWKQ